MVKKILFFTLSNFGDVVLSLPALDVLREKYPAAEITVMVGPRPAEIFKNNPYIHRLIIYDKYAALRKKAKLFFEFMKQRFDVVIDLRNTLYGALLPVRLKTSPFLYMPGRIRHAKEEKLYKLKKALREKDDLAPATEKSLYISREDDAYITSLLNKHGITEGAKFIILSPATGGRTRQWNKDKFLKLCSKLALDYPVILIGRKQDKELTEYIRSNSGGSIFDFAGLTNLAQLASLIKRSSLVVVCDTGILQLASYLDIPIIALFGPSDENRYGPWSSRFKVVTAQISCRPCRRPDCRFNSVECMDKISVNQVSDFIDAFLKS